MTAFISAGKELTVYHCVVSIDLLFIIEPFTLTLFTILYIIYYMGNFPAAVSNNEALISSAKSGVTKAKCVLMLEIWIHI